MVLSETRQQAGLATPRRSRWIVLIGATWQLGCNALVGSPAYPVAVEILSEGAWSGQSTPSPTVEVGKGTVTIEVQEGFGDPGYRIRASARSEPGASGGVQQGILVQVVTDRLDGDFIPIEWIRTYRLTVTSIPTGTYGLRLHWQNDYSPPNYQSRILVDTVVALP